MFDRRCYDNKTECKDVFWESTGEPRPRVLQGAVRSRLTERRCTGVAWTRTPPRFQPKTAPVLPRCTRRRHVRRQRRAPGAARDGRAGAAHAHGAAVVWRGPGQVGGPPVPDHVAGAQRVHLLYKRPLPGASRSHKTPHARPAERTCAGGVWDGRVGFKGAGRAAQARPWLGCWVAYEPLRCTSAVQHAGGSPSWTLARGRQVGTFTTPLRDGWGATNDGRLIVLSDGSANLTWVDPSNGFKRVKSLTVKDGGRPVRNLNEVGQRRRRRRAHACTRRSTPAAPHASSGQSVLLQGSPPPLA